MGYVAEVLPLNPFLYKTNVYISMAANKLTRAFPAIEAYLSEVLIKKTIEFQPDLVVSICPEVLPEMIEKTKKETDAIVVFWYTDSVANMGRQYMLAAPYDILFTKEPYMVELFRKKLNINTFYLPDACNPIWHNPVELNDDQSSYYGCDIAIVGNMYYYRALVLEQFTNYQIKIWGPMFCRWLRSPLRSVFTGKYVAREEKAMAFRAAKINLNTLHPSEIYGINARTFEITGCGGFQIAEYRPALKDLFEIDKEIVTFETIGELKEKVAYYMAHDDERKEIAQRAYERAHREHTYEHRLKTMMTAVLELTRS